MPYTEIGKNIPPARMSTRITPLSKVLAVVALTHVLTACVAPPSRTSAAPERIDNDRILFSHSEPQINAMSSSSAWSATVWSQVPVAVATEPERQPPTQEAASDHPPGLTILFANDRDALTPRALQKLDGFFKELPTNRSFKLKVTGHTDSNHTSEYNADLSKRRAESVKGWLVEQGFPATQIITDWQGLHQPAASNTDEDGRALNRRVDIRLQPG
jgi:outer membrane protein OmpA-like peptidoglycan-associated protein